MITDLSTRGNKKKTLLKYNAEIPTREDSNNQCLTDLLLIILLLLYNLLEILVVETMCFI